MSPTKPLHRDEDEEEEEVTEYEGDYDTDIASSVPHKDALKSHARESSFDESFSTVHIRLVQADRCNAMHLVKHN